MRPTPTDLRSRLRLRRGQRIRAGLGLVELLVALAITAALLTATAIALDASIQAYQINVQQAAILQGERVTMNRLVSTIRRSKLHAPDDVLLSGQFAAGAKVTGTGVAMFDANGTQITFRYDAANKTLNMLTGTTVHPMLRGVESFAVTMEPMRSAESVRTGGPWDLMRRATIIMTVGASDKTMSASERANSLKLTLSASVMPRRNAW